MNVTVIGTGYVGLVTGACLADVGNRVLCIDSSAEKIEKLRGGQIPIYEPGLETIVKQNAAAGRLNFSTDIRQGVHHGEVLFIAVGTPPDEDGSADLRHVLEVAHEIGRNIEDYRVVVTKSTVPVGTAEKVRAAIDEVLTERGVDVAFSMVSNPEFLKEGAAVEDFMKPDRIVVGTDTEEAVAMMRALYAPFNRSHDRMIFMDIQSAELTKYAANAMLATKISFMNEMANLAEKLGADIESVRLGIGSDPRIGYHFIYPGCGYGGSCFPKDVKALHRTAMEKGYDARLLTAVEDVNETQKGIVLNKIDAHYQNGITGRKFAIWGLAFKPDTDDMREAPSRVILEGLWQRGARASAFDPAAAGEAKRIFGSRSDLEIVDTPYDALDGADGLIVVTEWKMFRSPNLTEMRNRLNMPIVFDGRNIFDPALMRKSGFEYYGIGR